MTTLSELVAFRNSVKRAMSKLSIEPAIKTRISQFGHFQTNHPNVDYSERIKGFIDVYKDLIASNKENVSNLDRWLAELENDIEAMADSLVNNETFVKFNCDQLTGITSFSDVFDSKLVDTISTRIRGYCDWHYAGLQIGCRFKQWTDCMVTSDPLYLTAYYQDVVNQVVETYPTIYQRRLRVYTISVNELIKHLPQEQFGFVLAWEVFNYASDQEITNVLTQVLGLLRPGGTFMFSYNNCDLSESAHLVDIQAMTYSRKSKITELCQNLGYEVIQAEDFETGHDLYTHVSWCEVRRPGMLSTAKSHQVLGQIVEK